jgi:signal transduction histidine kinase
MIDGALGDERVLRRVRLGLVAWSGGITLVVLLILGAALYFVVAQSLRSSSETQLRDRASEVAELVASSRFLGQAGGPYPLGVSFGGASSGTFALIVPPAGDPIGPADEPVSDLPDAAAVAAARDGQLDIRDEEVSGVPVRILSEPVQRPDGTYVVQVVGDRTGEASTLGTLLVVLAGGGLLALALAAAAGFAYAGRALVPIRRSLDRQRRFAADASHELRTPLTVMRGTIQHLQHHPERTVGSFGEELGDVEGGIEQLGGLVDSLLLLARADSGVAELERKPLDLADWAAAALGPLGQLGAQRGVRLLLDAEPSPMLGDPQRLRQLTGLLTDNAIRLSPAGGHVTVSVHPGPGSVWLAVEDEGPGLRPEDLPHVFERFWRAPDAPPGGSGLGLAIANWIVERHGGTIEAQNRPTGGARFVARFPVQAPGRTEGETAPTAGR